MQMRQAKLSGVIPAMKRVLKDLKSKLNVNDAEAQVELVAIPSLNKLIKSTTIHGGIASEVLELSAVPATPPIISKVNTSIN